MKLPAILLAAGGSRRLGFPKQGVLVEGEPLLHRSARLAIEAGFAPVIVVLGSELEVLERLLSDLPVQIVPNPGWEEGMASSLRLGLAALTGQEDAVGILVCDQFQLEVEVLGRLKEAYASAPDRPAACVYGGAPGVPAIFPRDLFQKLAGLVGDKGARALLREREVTLCDWPEGRLDLDETKDMEGVSRTKGSE